VNRFFKLLQSDAMIAIKNETQTTRLTVQNYSLYHDSCNANETQTKRKRNASETQVKSIEECKELKNEKKEHYGEFVKLTKSEYNSLVEDFGEETTTDKIQDLNDYVGSKGTKYASHNLTIRAWIRKEEKKKKSDDKTHHKFLN